MHPIFRHVLSIAVIIASAATARAELPTGVTVVPFYDTAKAGLSFAKDKQSVVGMWEVPGRPEHFLVLGYFGYVWSLYPDTNRAYPPGALKEYAKKQIADFNNVVMKGWEQGALGAAFDPQFAENRFFYVIYNKYADAASYHKGLRPDSTDGPGREGLVVVERWKLSADYRSLARDTTIFAAKHSTGYGSSNMVFGRDGYLYITADSYSQNSWDSTNPMRKILRIDVSRRDPGRMYAIPPSNPWFNAANPAVKKEVYAFGFRNTYSITADYLTGKIWGAEVGQGTWEEINIIKPGANYGWGNGGDGAAVGNNSIGIEGPCSPTGGGFTSSGSDTGMTFGASQMTGYSREYKGRTYTCADFTNGTWNFNHGGADVYGSKTAVPGLPMNCIILSQAFRGDPASPFYGYHFVTDVAANYFVAVKEGVPEAVKVGGVPASMVFEGDRMHNGITSFAEDAYGNLYVTLLSSSSIGAFAWHDIFRVYHPQMKPLSWPRSQVVPTRLAAAEGPGRVRFNALFASVAGSRIRMPEGYSGVEVFSLEGRRLWTGRAAVGSGAGGRGSMGGGNPEIELPRDLKSGALGLRFIP
jgi:hypothetical protein